MMEWMLSDSKEILIFFFGHTHFSLSPASIRQNSSQRVNILLESPLASTLLHRSLVIGCLVSFPGLDVSPLLANTYFKCRYNSFAPKIKRAFERKTIVSDKNLKKGQDLLYFQIRERNP